jgi:hypothetical protein
MVVAIGLAGHAFAPDPCDAPCANAYGGGAAVLPSEFGTDTVPTGGSAIPVAPSPAPPAGTATL